MFASHICTSGLDIDKHAEDILKTWFKVISTSASRMVRARAHYRIGRSQSPYVHFPTQLNGRLSYFLRLILVGHLLY
jgi:hypothetical protein